MRKVLKILASVLALCLYLQAHVVVDMAGRKVNVPDKIEKVLTIGGVPAINSFVMALGYGDKIINGLPSWATMPKWKYEYVFAPQIKGMPVMQGAQNVPNMELILAAKPDVVITFSTAIANTLAKKGLAVVVIKWQNASDVVPVMSMLGEVFGKQARAKKYIAYFDTLALKAKRLRSKIRRKDTAIYTQLSTLSVPHLIAKWWIENAGGIDVSALAHKEPRLIYSLEQLLGWDPDVIFLQSRSDRDLLFSDARFKTLRALRAKRVYVVPVGAHVWGNCTAENPLSVLWAMNKLYPSIYSDEELFKDTKGFYDTFYGGVLTDANIREILSGNNK